MRGIIPPEVFQECLHRQRAEDARASRMAARRVFAEMVCQEKLAGRLTWRRRRALLRFARKLGLDDYELRLLARAAEEGVGLTGTAESSSLAREYLAEIDHVDRRHRARWVIAALALLNVLVMLRWMIR
jgi:hypothetical protein